MLPYNYFIFLFFLCLTQTGGQLFSSFYSLVPAPIDHLFNSSFHAHYGSYLSPTGSATLWSVSTFCSQSGILIGLFLLGLVDIKGRKCVLIWIGYGLSFSIGSIFLLSFYFNCFEAFLVQEFLGGVAVQLRRSTSAIFISESAPDHLRGLSMIITSIGESINAFLCSILLRPNIFGNDESVIIVPSIALSIFLTTFLYLAWIPESPKYLIERKKFIEAEKAINFYHGKGADPEKFIYDTLLEKGKRNDERMSIKYRQLWTDATLRKVFFLCFCLYNFFDVSVVSIEFLFFTRVNLLLGLAPETAMTVNSICKMAHIPLFLLPAVGVERWGRRKLILFGFCLMNLKIILMIIGMSLATFAGTSMITQSIGIFEQISSMVGSVLTPHGLVSLVTCELTSSQARVTVLQTAMFVSTITGTIFISLLPYAFNFLPALPYIFLAIYQPCLMYYIYQNLPETSGRAVYKIVEDFSEAVRSRAPTRRTTLISEEKIPLLQ